jgi:hypothetical protein
MTGLSVCDSVVNLESQFELSKPNGQEKATEFESPAAFSVMVLLNDALGPVPVMNF